MSDLINRQAAIDAIVNRTVIVDTDAQWLSGHARCELEIIDIINALPSAEPEEPETRSISFEDYCVALVAMWMDGIVTNEEYKRIMAKVIAHEKAERGKKNGRNYKHNH